MSAIRRLLDLIVGLICLLVAAFFALALLGSGFGFNWGW